MSWYMLLFQFPGIAERWLIEDNWAGPPPQFPPVQAPTMGIWSPGDMALSEVQMTGSARNVAGPWRYERLDGPGHWKQLDAPGKVNQLLLDFLPADPVP
jgi:pimeloyl-ACP methyl ester carboxylesterase